MNSKGNVIVFLVLIAVIIIGIMVLHLPTFVPLMICTAVVSLYAAIAVKKPVKEVFKTIVSAALDAPWLLLLSIGTLIASWVQCGAVPFLVSYGLRLIEPHLFLPLVLLVCAAMSTVTGSSWTTCGTLGIAFIGMSMSLGIPSGMTIGAVLCGAFFGDKISRLSDFAVSTVSIARADFSRHVRLMLRTAVPSLLISLMLFFIIGRAYAGNEADFSSINGILESLDRNFNLSPVTLVPLVVLVTTLLLKLPATIPVLLSTLSAVIISLAVQKTGLADALLPLVSGFSIESGNSLVDSICNRGGLVSMLKIALLVIFAFTMGAVLKKTRIMDTVASPVKKMVRGRLSLYVATYLIGAVMAFTTGSGTIGVIVSYNVLSSFYDRFRLDHGLYTRTICEMITIQQPMVIWGSSGAFVAQCFGVSASVYAPYYFMAYLLPLAGILLAAVGRRSAAIERKTINVVAAVIRQNGRIFATQRGYGNYKGWWEFPGGKIELGETPQAALMREIKEELDTEIEVGDLIANVEYDYPEFHLVMDCFWCTVRSGKLTLLEAEDARWLSKEDLFSVKWLPADLEILEKVAKGL